MLTFVLMVYEIFSTNYYQILKMVVFEKQLETFVKYIRIFLRRTMYHTGYLSMSISAFTQQ